MYSCGKCLFFYSEGERRATPDEVERLDRKPQTVRVGTCKRYPKGIGKDGLDWCGEFVNRYTGEALR